MDYNCILLLCLHESTFENILMSFFSVTIILEKNRIRTLNLLKKNKDYKKTLTYLLGEDI